MTDARDSTTWVALELTSTGEDKAVRGELAQALRKELGIDESHPVFIPCSLFTKGGRRVVLQAIEGYAFVASGLSDTKYFALENGSLVSQVISSTGVHGMRVIHCMPDSSIQKIREQLNGSSSDIVSVGDTVRIRGGNYRGLYGEVVSVHGNRGAIRITLKSIDIITWQPMSILDARDDVEGYDSYEDFSHDESEES